jgi:hypothetical protein
LYLIIVIKLQECGEKPMFHLQSQWIPETNLLPVRSVWRTSAWKLHWEIVWRNAPRIWRDFESALPFQTHLTQTKPVLPLSNKHSSQVKDQVRRQCYHNQHKKFPYWPTRDESLLSGHTLYLLPAFGLMPGGSSTVHIYTQTIHRTTQLTTLVGRLSGIWAQGGQTKINDELTA